MVTWGITKDVTVALQRTKKKEYFPSVTMNPLQRHPRVHHFYHSALNRPGRNSENKKSSLQLFVSLFGWLIK